ncbi:hypothetical protein ABBQ38_008003 [Trebouxia sp. C0009 RCD-2024]
MLMLPNHQESPGMFKERVQTTLDELLHEHADQTDFVKYFRSTWVHKFDLRVRFARSYKQEGYQHNRKKEQLVASAVIASQHIPDSSVTLAACATQPAHVVSQHSASTLYEVHVTSAAQTCTCPQGQLHYPCKHVMKVISMTTGKSGPEIILALGTWAGTELGGLAQLQSDECMAQLKDNFMLDDTEPAEAAQPDSTSTAADTKPAGKVVNDSSEAPAINAEPDVNAAISDDKLDELYQMLKSSSAAQPELRHQLATHMRLAKGVMERLTADSACSLTYPAATLTQRQDGLNNSLVRLASFVENPLAKRAKPAQAAESQADAVDQLAPFAKPKPKSKKRTFAQQLADKVGNKENTSAASNSQPAQLPLQVAVEAAAKPAPAKRQPRQQRCMECKACLNRATGKQGCERNKAKRLAEQNGAVQQLDV